MRALVSSEHSPEHPRCAGAQPRSPTDLPAFRPLPPPWRLVQAGHGDQVCFLFEGNEPGRQGVMTYGEVLKETCRVVGGAGGWVGEWLGGWVGSPSFLTKRVGEACGCACVDSCACLVLYVKGSRGVVLALHSVTREGGSGGSMPFLSGLRPPSPQHKSGCMALSAVHLPLL